MGRPTGLRLDRINVIRYQMPLKRAYGTARGVTRAAINFLVQLTVTDGERVVEGVGECQPRHALTGDGGKDRVAAWGFLCAAADHLTGRSVRFTGPEDATEAVREVMAKLHDLASSHADHSNRDRPFRGTLLGIEVALLDVVGQVLDLQIAEVLGKQRDEIGISISTISSSTRLDEVADKAIKQVRYPMTRVKGLGDNDYNLRLLDAVAQANRSVGREKPLWIDINEALDYQGAADLLRQIADRMGSGALPASVVVEGMLPKREVDKLPELQRLADSECQRHLTTGHRLDLRIMPDEGLWDKADLARLNTLGGCRAINIKAPKAGGLLASLDLARAAIAADPGVHISIGGMIGTSDITAWALHNLARALPRVDYLTAVPPQNVQERIAEPRASYVSRESNLIAPQTTPGLGTRLRMDRLAPYIDATYSPSTRDTPDRTGSPMPVGSRTLVFAGDTSMGDVYVRRQGGRLAERLEERPMSFFEGLRPLVAEHDAFILNLETVLADTPESPFEGRKPYLGWDSPARTLSCLQQLGVDAVGLANNHTMDFGAEHLLLTKAYLNEAGIRTFGAGTSRDEAAAPLTLTLEFGDVTRRVHIIGAMQMQSKLRDEYGFYASKAQTGVNGLSVSRASSMIAQLRAADPASLIIVFPHWGRNYQWADDRLQKAAAAMTAAGADLILGHGAHMLQQCTFSETNAVVYSLGNFQFNWGGRFQTMGAPPFGLVARTTVTPHEDAWRLDLRLYPILIDNRVTGHVPVAVDDERFEQVWAALCKVDLDGSFARRAQAERDALGKHIRYSFTTGRKTSRASVESASSVTPPASQATPNAYDDPESLQIRGQLDRRLLGSLLIAREAERSGASINWLSSDSFVASRSGRRLLFAGNRCTETVPAGRVVKDKALLKELLIAKGVTVPAGGPAKNLTDAQELFQRLARTAVVKPRRGDRGAGVTVGVNNLDDLGSAYARADADGGVLVEEMVDGQEFRCMCTPDQCIGVYSKDRPRIIGNGEHSVRELVDRKNRYRAANPALFKKLIVVDDELVRHLRNSGLTLDSVPAAGEVVVLGNLANTYQGGEITECTDSAPEIVKETAVAAVAAVPGLAWAGVDLILERTADGAERAAVLEVNVNAGIANFHFPSYGKPRNVARRIWETRLAAADSERFGDIENPRVPPVDRRTPPAALPAGDPQQIGTSIGAAFIRCLSSYGYHTERLGDNLFRAQKGGGAQLLFNGCASTEDLAVVARVVNRHTMVRRLLRGAQVPVPAGRTASSVEEVTGFVGEVATSAVMLPTRGDTVARARAVVDASSARAELEKLFHQVGRGKSVVIQAAPPGTRLRIFATRRGGHAVACDVESAATVSDDTITSGARLATEAVRAIPQLRWAVVDVLIPQCVDGSPRGEEALVEQMSMRPALAPAQLLVAGSIDDFFDALLPSKTQRLPHQRAANVERLRRWLRRPLIR